MLIRLFTNSYIDHSLIYDVRLRVERPEAKTKKTQKAHRGFFWVEKRLEREETAEKAKELLENKGTSPEEKYGVEVHYWMDKEGRDSSFVYSMLDGTYNTAFSRINQIVSEINKYRAVELQPRGKK